MKKLIAGNWKMNCSIEESKSLISGIIQGQSIHPLLAETCELLVCPPQIYLTKMMSMAKAIDANIHFGAQDCSPYENGAYTGDVSAMMLSGIGCEYVIVGHSERRQYYKENGELIKSKAEKIIQNKMRAILCVGESETQRDFGQAIEVVLGQLDKSLPEGATAQNVVIAYEPVWAIGTGKVATVADVHEMHKALHEKLKEKLADGANIRILYGGSVKPENAGEILNIEHVDGALIGGASLQADSFLGIAKAL